MPIFDKQALKQFIFDASRAAYASGDSSLRIRQPDGSTSIEYSKPPFRYHDNYFGGEPYGGREVVFFDGKPIWMMVYYGRVLEGDIGKVYGFLEKALSANTVDAPYRGPAVFKNDGHNNGLRYENVLEGDVESFHGVEKIFKDDVCIYEAIYAGGLVDSRA